MSEQKHRKITFVVIVVFAIASIIMGAIVIIGSDLSEFREKTVFACSGLHVNEL
jgi:hypothetical protein